MKNTLNKFNFILGILSVIITFVPGMLIGEFAIIAIKVIGKIINSIISIFPSIYLRGFIDIIFIPILLFRKFTKLNINWLPSIIILVPILLWFGGIRQIERYAELYEGLYFVSISAGFILGTFLPLYYAYLFSKEVDKS